MATNDRKTNEEPPPPANSQNKPQGSESSGIETKPAVSTRPPRPKR